MSDIVFQNVGDTFTDQSKHGFKNTNVSEFHDVIARLGVLQCLGYETGFTHHMLTNSINTHFSGDIFVRIALLLLLITRVSQVVEVFLLQSPQEVLVDVLHIDALVTEPDHTATTDGGQGSMLQTLDLKHNSDVRRDRKTLTTGQCQQFVIIEDGIKILGPFGVDITIEDDPMTFAALTSNIVENLSQDLGENTISPFQSGRIQPTIQFFLVDSLGIDNVRFSLDSINTLDGFHENLPTGSLTTTNGSDHHNTMLQVLDLIQLQCLLQEFVIGNDVVHLGDLLDGVCQHFVLDGNDFRSGENTRQQVGQQNDIFRDQLGNDSVTNTLQQDLLLPVGDFAGIFGSILGFGSLQVTGTDQDTLQSSQTEIIMRLTGQLIVAKFEQGNDLSGKFFGTSETLRIHHNLGNQFSVGLNHGNGSKQLLQVIRKVGSSSIARIHGNEDTHGGIQFDVTTQEINLGGVNLESHLDGQNLLRDG
mmetsp:Transcript_40202/g.45967  ORF Transcript_40202/g.45967 Transcript_40202/m.45967 type:complete len:475 (-) Transcript_40202:626-2050(-)